MEIKEIKQTLKIQTLLNYYSLKLDKNNQINCPFHADKHPSMKIYHETNTYHCFGCGKTGDSIQFIQDKEKISKHQAILKAKDMINNKTQNTNNKTQILAKQSNISNLTSNISYLKQFTSFKQAIIRSPKAKEYAEKRHLNIDKLEIGYNSGKTYKQMKNCLIFPLKNKENQIVSFYGRSILDKENAKHFYTAGRTGLYPEHPKGALTKLILTESVIDASTLLQDKYIYESCGVLALYGTNGLTAEHLEAIKNIEQLREIILFFDGDQAGRKAIMNYKLKIMNLFDDKIKLSAVETPENEDVNSLLDGHEPDIFKHLLENRKQLFLSTEKDLFETEKPLIETEKPKAIINNQSTIFNPSNPDYITLTTNDLKITILGGINLQQLDRLRITIKITHLSNSVRNNIDLYNIDQIDRFINKASEKLETATSTLNKAISELTDQLETYRLNKLESIKTQKPKDRKLTASREQKAINCLKQKDLLKRTNQDIGKTGMIGEENNRLLMYLIFTSRLRKQPLHIISLGGSGTGKTYLQEKISELIPEQEKKEITILSENAFYYFEKTELKHKLVLIEDMDGAEQVLYPLRELQSKKKISKTVPIKDSKGNLKTITLNVEGPICLSGTTTKEHLYEDNANRSILIYLDNSKEQKEEIMDYQRKLSAGKIDTKKEEEIKEFFKDIQSVLRPIKVRNPYAEQLKIPEYVFKPLRTNSHYLTFIETVTFYHQYQRTLKTDSATGEKYILTEIEDIEEANKLIKDDLLAKSDELTKTLRDFFEQLKKWINKNNKQSFYSKELQERLRIYPMKINRYLRELESRNFIRRTGGNRKKGFEYEIYRTDEYQKLQSGINILDDILEKIKQNKGKPEVPVLSKVEV